MIIPTQDEMIAILCRIYTRIATLYVHRTRPAIRDSYLQPLLKLNAGARILDVGAGTGHDAEVLVRAGYHVTCVDISPDMCAVARKHLAPLHNVEIFQGDSGSVDFPGESFDAILSALEIFHHCDVVKTIQHYSHMLAPDGLLILVTNHPARNFLMRQTKMQAKSYFDEGLVWEDWGEPHELMPKYYWTLRSYLAAIRDAGLTILDINEYPPTADLAALQDQAIPAGTKYPSLITFICKK